MSLRKRFGHTRVGEIPPSQFVILDSETLPQNLISLLTPDGDVTGDLLIPLDPEGSDCDPSLGGNGILASEILEHLLSFHELVPRLASGDVEHQLLNLDRPHGVVLVLGGHCRFPCCKDLKIFEWLNMISKFYIILLWD